MERGSAFVEAERLFIVLKQPEDCVTVKKGALMHVFSQRVQAQEGVPQVRNTK